MIRQFASLSLMKILTGFYNLRLVIRVLSKATQAKGPQKRQIFRRHQYFFVTLSLCLSEIALAGPSISIIEYCDIAQNQNIENYKINNSRKIADIDYQLAEHQYDTILSPIASLETKDSKLERTIGFSASKKTLLGPEIDLSFKQTWRSAELEPYDRSFSVTVNQGILRRWGEDYASLPITRERLNQEGVEIEAIDRKRSLLAQSIQRYFSFLRATLKQQITQSALNLGKQTLEKTLKETSLGQSQQANAARAKLALLAYLDASRTVEQQVLRSKDTFYLHAQLDEHQRYQPISRFPDFRVQEQDKSADNYSNRAAWNRLQLALKKAELALWESERDTWPDINLSVSYAYSRAGDTFFDHHESEDNWYIGLTTSPDLDLSAKNKVRAQKKLIVEELRQDILFLEREIDTQIENLLYQINSDQQALELSKLKVDQARKALQAESILYSQNMTDNEGLIDAQETLFYNQLQVVERRISINLKIVELSLFKGTLSIEWLENQFDHSHDKGSNT